MEESACNNYVNSSVIIYNPALNVTDASFTRTIVMCFDNAHEDQQCTKTYPRSGERLGDGCCSINPGATKQAVHNKDTP